MATMAARIVGAVTIMDGTAAVVTTKCVTIAAGKAFAASAFVIPIARTICECSDANGRAHAARPVQQSASVRTYASAGVQPRPISTAIRIRSE